MTLPERIVVTGASGFVGRHLCQALRERGASVCGVVRAESAPLPIGVERAVIEDITDVRGLCGAMAGADVVIHLAARVHVVREDATDPLAAFRRVNLQGTRAVIEAAGAAGVRGLVYASSIKALGERSERPWQERDAPRPVDPYGQSKLESESVVRDLAPAAGVQACILRLPLVYGPGVGANMLWLFRAVARGVPLPLGSVENRRSLLFVGNLVAAVEAVLRTPGTAGELLHVTDLEDLSTPDLIREIAGALAKPARLVPVPHALLAAVGHAGDALGRLMPVPITSAVIERVTGSLMMDASRLVHLTGYRPAYSVRAGLAATATWFLSPERETHL